MRQSTALLVAALAALVMAPVGAQVVCGNGPYSCAAGQTCCPATGGGYGCCPVASASCCPDLIHCCPPTYPICSSGGCLSETEAASSAKSASSAFLRLRGPEARE